MRNINLWSHLFDNCDDEDISPIWVSVCDHISIKCYEDNDYCEYKQSLIIHCNECKKEYELTILV